MSHNLEVDDLGVSPSFVLIAVMRAVPSSAAEPLHDALRNGLEENREAGRFAGRAVLRTDSGRPMLSLPSNYFVETSKVSAGTNTTNKMNASIL